MAHDVFISYSNQDKAIAEAVCTQLEATAIGCWIAPRDVLGGVPYGEALVDAINASRILVLVFSSDSNRSPQVKREIERAVSKEIPIVPFRIEDVPLSKDLEYFISLPHWLDAMTPPMEKHLERLAATVVQLLSKTSAAQATQTLDRRELRTEIEEKHKHKKSIGDPALTPTTPLIHIKTEPRKTWRQTKRRWLPLLMIALLAALSANLGVAWVGWLGHQELAVHQHRLLNAPLAPNPEISLITIQKDTLRKLGIQNPVSRLPRTYHAQLIYALRDAKAHALVLDLRFLKLGEPKEDEALRQALAKSDPLHITLATANKEEDIPERDPNAPGGWRYRFASPVVLPNPLPSNVTVASAIAFDPGRQLDGAILLQRDEKTQRLIPHLALSAVLGRFNVAPSDAHLDNEGQHLIAGRFVWPVGQDGELHAYWTQRQGMFPTHEYADALKALRSEQGRSFFQNKIVIVGDASSADKDIHSTPLGMMHGTEFVAHLINTLLIQEVASGTRWHIPANMIWSGILAMVAAVAMSTLRPLIILMGGLGAFATAVLIPGLAQNRWNVWVDTIGPCLAVVIATGLTALLEVIRAGVRERHFAANPHI